jgi:hypothetical protein
VKARTARCRLSSRFVNRAKLSRYQAVKPHIVDRPASIVHQHLSKSPWRSGERVVVFATILYPPALRMQGVQKEDRARRCSALGSLLYTVSQKPESHPQSTSFSCLSPQQRIPIVECRSAQQRSTPAQSVLSAQRHPAHSAKSEEAQLTNRIAGLAMMSKATCRV